MYVSINTPLRPRLAADGAYLTAPRDELLFCTFARTQDEIVLLVAKVREAPHELVVALRLRHCSPIESCTHLQHKVIRKDWLLPHRSVRLRVHRRVAFIGPHCFQ